MRLTRFGVLGDVHTEDVALSAALDVPRPRMVGP